MREKDREVLEILVNDQKLCDLIDNNKFKELYEDIRYSSEYSKWSGLLTELLLESDINPLQYCDGHIPAGYLSYSRNIDNFDVPSNITHIDNFAFGYSNINNITFHGPVKIIGKRVFRGCKKLNKLILPDGVKEIGDEAFDLSGIKELVLPTSVTKLGTEIFCNYHSAQNGALSDIKIMYRGTNDQWDKIKKNDWFLDQIVLCNYQ